MSFRPPKCVQCKAGRVKTPSSHLDTPHHIIPVQDAPRKRLAQGTSHLPIPRVQPLFTMPGNREYTELPGRPDRDGLPTTPSLLVDDHGEPLPPPHIDITTQIFQWPGQDEVNSRCDRTRKKREKQYSKWVNVVIPSLLAPYMRLLRETDSLSSPIRDPVAVDCTCGRAVTRRLKVVCVCFDREWPLVDIQIQWLILSIGLEATELHVCDCRPAALQLLNRGYFPCAPTAPTLAVDLKVLELVRELFLRATPNVTAWSDTLEAFLAGRKYKLKTRVR